MHEVAAKDVGDVPEPSLVIARQPHRVEVASTQVDFLGLRDRRVHAEDDERLPIRCHVAAALAPATLRSLDAIHQASALAIGEELTEIVTYDLRLAAAARIARLEVRSPG